MNTKSQRIAACLIAVQMVVLSGAAFADESYTRNSYDSYKAAERDRVTTQQAGAFGVGMLSGGLGAAVLSQFLPGRRRLEVPFTLAGAIVGAVALSHYAPDSADKVTREDLRKKFISSAMNSPEFKTLAHAMGSEAKATVFVLDLADLYETDLDDEAVIAFRKKYSKIYLGENKEISDPAVESRGSKVFSRGNPVALAAEILTEQGSDASSSGKALE